MNLNQSPELVSGKSKVSVLRWLYAVGGIVLIVGLIWIGRKWNRSAGARTILVYCYTGMQEVMENGIFPAFQDYWLREHGERVDFIPTFAGSGAITDQILSRLPAEVAILASEMDALRISERGLTTVRSWRELPNAGVCCRTPLAFVVRPGNPQQLFSFSDLTRPGLTLIHPDPHYSGAGQWSLLASFSTALRAGKSPDEAFEQLQALWRNIESLPTSARNALQLFQQGQGDVLLAYESDFLASPDREQVNAESVSLIETVLCEPVVLTLNQNIYPDNSELVASFAQFLWSETSQRLFVDYGFYSLLDSLNLQRDDYTLYDNLLTLDRLGGAATCRVDIIDRFLSQLSQVSTTR